MLSASQDAAAGRAVFDPQQVPLSLYVHFPWCVRKCPYCDFNSHAVDGDVPEDAYIEALLRDLEFEVADFAPRPLQSIFLGGGTPSLFSAAAIARLLQGVGERLPLAPAAEITLEANPGTVDAGHFPGYRDAGVNRLSIGVQSWDRAMLQRLGRIHDDAQAERAVHLARAAGFDNLNLDLMYGLPQQSLQMGLADLERSFALRPEHLSWYQLTIEPHTAFHQKPPLLPPADDVADLEIAGRARLSAAGYRQYEVSAYAREGRQSRHNLNYWTFGDYLAIGAGAHGKRSQGDGIWRRIREPHPRRYLEKAGTPGVLRSQEAVSREQLPFEFALNAFRLTQGFALEDFERRTGAPASLLARGLARATERGLSERLQARIQPTARGQAFLNDLIEGFLP